ncbi:hypothetical protein, partial [Lactobacillus crispatus]|uniref:hypothetical protein n=1 Tax=Lactobacillus crispatus TaxID=47770 RepID=UPI001E4D09E8
SSLHKLFYSFICKSLQQKLYNKDVDTITARTYLKQISGIFFIACPYWIGCTAKIKKKRHNL